MPASYAILGTAVSRFLRIAVVRDLRGERQVTPPAYLPLRVVGWRAVLRVGVDDLDRTGRPRHPAPAAARH